MTINKDKLINNTVSFLHGRIVLYVDSLKGTSHNYIEGLKEELVEVFLLAGYRFLFLPDLVKNLSPEMLRYQYPGQESSSLIEDIYRNIQEIAELDDRSGFLYKQNGRTYFRPIPESPESDIKAAIDEFISFLSHFRVENEDQVLFRKRSAFPEESGILYDIDESCLPMAEYSVSYDAAVDEERLAPKTQAIIDAWEQIERQFGITLDDLEIILRYRIKLSHLNITTSNRIFLPDLEGNPEVKLDDLTKALYFFYLRHPKGVAFKELQDYENEIYRIYSSITGREDVEGIKRSVSALVSPYSDGRNSCVSRVKKAFRDIVGDRIAQYYYIDGRYAEKRLVRIDRDLVIWDHPLLIK